MEEFTFYLNPAQSSMATELWHPCFRGLLFSSSEVPLPKAGSARPAIILPSATKPQPPGLACGVFQVRAAPSGVAWSLEPSFGTIAHKVAGGWAGATGIVLRCFHVATWGFVAQPKNYPAGC